MSNESFLVTNPKNNNVDLEITFVNGDGLTKRCALVKPGDTFKVEKKSVSVREIPHPARFELLENGEYVKDTKRGPILKVV